MAGLPNGALVLPGLDQTLDEESWNAIVPAHPEHPQFGLKKLLDALERAARGRAAAAGPDADAGASASARRLVSEAMRPARTTERWHQFIAERQQARTWRRRCGRRRRPGGAQRRGRGGGDRAHPARGGRRRPGRTAALVTPDRALARRVAAQARGVGTCASMTRPASRSPRPPSARSSISSLEAAAKRFEPVALVSLLKHPLLPARHGRPRAAARPCARSSWRPSARPTSARGWTASAAALERAQADLRDGKRRHRGGPQPERRRLAGGAQAGATSSGRRLRAAGGAVSVLGQVGSLCTIAEAHVEAAAGAGHARAATGRPALVAGRGRRAGARSSSPRSLDGDVPAPDMARGRLSRVLSQPRRRRERSGRAGRRIRAFPSGSPTSRACSSPTW